jgi:hypothetical protein
MQLKLKGLLFLSTLFMFQISGNAQSVPKEYGYYIEIKGFKTKADIKNFESLIKAKNGVSFFNSYSGTPMFHVLKSNKSISQTDFIKWIEPLRLQLIKFEAKEITADFIRSKKIKKKSRDKKDS